MGKYLCVMQINLEYLPQIISKVRELYPNENINVVASEVYSEEDFPLERFRQLVENTTYQSSKGNYHPPPEASHYKGYKSERASGRQEQQTDDWQEQSAQQ